MNPLIIIGFFLVLLIVLGMAAAMIMGNDREQKQRMMAVIKGRGGPAEGDEKSKKSEGDKRRAEIAKKLKEEDEDSGKKKRKATLESLFEQAGLKISVKKYWMFSFLSCLIFIMSTKIFGYSNFVALMAGIIGLFGLPRFIVRRKINKRQKQFLEEFADALEAMVRLLKAGMPVTEAIAMASKEFTGPVGEEMMRIYDAQKVGISLPEATLEAARRMPLTEMQMFATGISIQQQTGASLSEVLLNLAGVIRARFKLKRKVKALSSEAKASAGIIGCLPFLVGGAISLINPDYMGILFESTAGKVMLVGSAIWMSMGIFIMKAMINFKV